MNQFDYISAAQKFSKDKVEFPVEFVYQLIESLEDDALIKRLTIMMEQRGIPINYDEFDQPIWLYHKPNKDEGAV